MTPISLVFDPGILWWVLRNLSSYIYIYERVSACVRAFARVSACTVCGLGNRCSGNDENRQFGVTFHRGAQREIGFDLGSQGQGSNVRWAIFRDCHAWRKNRVGLPLVNLRCEKNGSLEFDLRGQGQGSTLASSISCSDKDQNDIPGVNMRCGKCGSLRFDLRGQAQGLCQRCVQQRSF